MRGYLKFSFLTRKISQNEYIPADIILLTTSEKKGICYVETKNLDGETNLKAKLVQKELGEIFRSENVKINRNRPKFFCFFKFAINRVIFQYERPTNYLYCFNGKQIIDSINYFHVLTVFSYFLIGAI